MLFVFLGFERKRATNKITPAAIGKGNLMKHHLLKDFLTFVFFVFCFLQSKDDDKTRPNLI